MDFGFFHRDTGHARDRYGIFEREDVFDRRGTVSIHLSDVKTNTYIRNAGRNASFSSCEKVIIFIGVPLYAIFVFRRNLFREHTSGVRRKIQYRSLALGLTRKKARCSRRKRIV